MTAHRASAGQRGMFLLQSTVALIVAAMLIVVMLVRTRQYNDEAERLAVQQMVDTLRASLGLRMTRARQQGPAAVARLAEENPFDWLDRKPDNYLGEYYSPELKEMPGGNWVFDRRDRTVIYLLKSHRSFSSEASNSVKFKVEFAQALLPRVKNGPAEVPNGLVIEQVHDQTAIDTD